ncbi:MAG TPA: hypothetical protein VIM61_09310 [Chthoniobacterales bacterium]
MPRTLNLDAGLHDAVGKKHKTDKAEKRSRERSDFIPVPNFVREAGGGVLSGTFKPATPLNGDGIVFRVGRDQAENDAWATKPGKRIPALYAQPDDGEPLMRELVALANGRRGYKDIVAGGTVKLRKLPKHAAHSLVSTAPPWAVEVLSKLPQEDFLAYMKGGAGIVATTTKDVSGRMSWSVSAHWDSAVPHWHSSVAQTYDFESGSTHGFLHPKSRFYTPSSRDVGGHRIMREFPGLLDEEVARQVSQNLSRPSRAGKRLLTIEIADELDSFTEEFFRQRGLSAEYAKAKENYREKKEIEQDVYPRLRVVERTAQYAAKAKGKRRKKAIHLLGHTVAELLDRALWAAIPPAARLPLRLAFKAYRIYTSSNVPVTRSVADEIQHQLLSLVKSKLDYAIGKPESPRGPR